MKTLLTLLAGIVLWPATSTLAQGAEEQPFPKSIIKSVPFELTESTFMLEWEKINKDADGSFSLGVGLTSGTTYDGERKGIKGEFIKRFYLNNLKQVIPRKDREPYIRGIYGAVFLRGGYASVEERFYHYNSITGNSSERTNKTSGNWAFPGVMIGAVRTFWDTLFLELYVGAGVRISEMENSDPLYEEDLYNYIDVYDIAYNGVAPNIGFKIGIGIK